MTGAIDRIVAWEALDSRGRPTVGCDVALSGGAVATVTVPSGASTGRHEARELRDGGDRYGGWGVRTAIAQVNERIAPAVRGMPADDGDALDAVLVALDGTPALSSLGANAVLAVSLAVRLAAARQEGVPLFRRLAGPAQPVLPLPMVNVFSGGAHARGAVDVQDVLFVPVGADSMAQALEWAVAVRAAAATRLERAGFCAALVADEGGLAAPLHSNRAAVELVAAAIEDAGLRPGEQGAVALDIAASQLLRDGRYVLRSEERELDAAELVAEIAGWCRDLPIVSVEDPVGEDDAGGWALARDAMHGIQLLGDDLFATNADRLAERIPHGWANAIVIKPNQNGTLTGTRDVLRKARRAGYATVVSARSGETEDTWLADLAVGLGAGQIKVGSTMRSERTAKWNRLLRIEAVLAPDLAFAGRRALAPAGAPTTAAEHG
jgi:enolase